MSHQQNAQKIKNTYHDDFIKIKNLNVDYLTIFIHFGYICSAH